jgi:hypothetical protein
LKLETFYNIFNIFKFIPKVGARPSTQGRGKMNKKLKGGKKFAKELKDVHGTRSISNV